MKSILFLQSDVMSVLQPLFWLCLMLWGSAVLMAALGLAFWFFSRWYWVDRAEDESHEFLHQLTPQEIQVLEQSIAAAGSQEDRLRLIVVRLAARGMSENLIAACAGVEKRTIDGWLHIYEEMGLAGLKS